MKLSKLIEELEEVRDFLHGTSQDPGVKFFHREEGEQVDINRVVVNATTGATYLSSEPLSPQEWQHEKSLKERNAEIERLLVRKGFRVLPPGPHRNNEGIRVRGGAVIVDFDSRQQVINAKADLREVLDECGMHSVKIR